MKIVVIMYGHSIYPIVDPRTEMPGDLGALEEELVSHGFSLSESLHDLQTGWSSKAQVDVHHKDLPNSGKITRRRGEGHFTLLVNPEGKALIEFAKSYRPVAAS